MKFVNEKKTVWATSDLHGDLSGLDPSGSDIAVIAGDIAPLSRMGNYDEQKVWWRCKMVPWIRRFPGVQFVMIPGNHDILLEKDAAFVRDLIPGNCRLLINEQAVVCGKRIYGTPFVPVINHRWAFEVEEIVQHEVFSAIPEGLDILVTHTPPSNGDDEYDVSLERHHRRHFGSKPLTYAIAEKKPSVCVFGHIHSGCHKQHQIGDTRLFNVSRVGENYMPKFAPMVFQV